MTIDIHEILQRLPHRYPFLLIDRVVTCNPGSDLQAIKNVTVNEPFFQGHFPRFPIFPGVLMLESMAQAAAVLAAATVGEDAGGEGICLFAGIDNARFRRPVMPGDQLWIDVKLVRRKRDLWRCAGRITVDDQTACDAELLFTYRDLK